MYWMLCKIPFNSLINLGLIVNTTIFYKGMQFEKL
jgi:hypothetical protein